MHLDNYVGIEKQKINAPSKIDALSILLSRCTFQFSVLIEAPSFLVD